MRANPSWLAQPFENLMRNAIEHTSQYITVTVGEPEDGFYIEDDGSNMPEGIRDDVLEAGYTTTDEGTGFGLPISSKFPNLTVGDHCDRERARRCTVRPHWCRCSKVTNVRYVFSRLINIRSRFDRTLDVQ